MKSFPHEEPSALNVYPLPAALKGVLDKTDLEL